MLALSEVTRTQSTCQNCRLKFQQFSSKSLRQLSLLCQRVLSFISNGNCSSLDKCRYGQCTLGSIPMNKHISPTTSFHLFSTRSILPFLAVSFTGLTQSRFCTFYHDTDDVWNNFWVNFHETPAFPSFQNLQNTHLLNEVSSHKLLITKSTNIKAFKVRPVASIQQEHWFLDNGTKLQTLVIIQSQFIGIGSHVCNLRHWCSHLSSKMRNGDMKHPTTSEIICMCNF